MTIRVDYLKLGNTQSWDAYVRGHSNGGLYHLSGWGKVIESAYGHKPYYIMAIKETHGGNHNSNKGMTSASDSSTWKNEKISKQVVGILPLVHMKHVLFGSKLFSLPFFDLGGVLADDEKVERMLVDHAIALGKHLDAKSLELRHENPLLCLSNLNTRGSSQLFAFGRHSPLRTNSHKVRMLLDIPDSPESLMKSFKSKLRSQIKKPMKEGLTSKVGGSELLDDFYNVFLLNMRDLGSPVHSKSLIKIVLNEFPEEARICIVKKGKKPLAASVIIGFKKILENPWASALREYSKLSPNMLLYWTMLQFACEKGFEKFDFGRSTPDEGTYKFKQQWGARPSSLHWHCFSLRGRPRDMQTTDKSKFNKGIQYWQKIPVPLTRIIGPMIRKHIGL